MNWPEEIYSFTKPGKAIVTWKFVMKTEDGRAEYYSNYHQRNWISQMELDNYYFTSLESCYIAWIESIEKFKQKVIKQFENKCGVKYFDIVFSKLVENHNKRRQNEMDKSE